MFTKKYKVIIEPFAQNNYLKKVKKKYNKSFDIPWKGFVLMLEKFDSLLERGHTNVIVCVEDGISICKTGFKIAQNESVKSSGNRCIVVQDSHKKAVRILLVYHKGDIRKGSNETQWWKKMIKDNYSEYKDCL